MPTYPDVAYRVTIADMFSSNITPDTALLLSHGELLESTYTLVGMQHTPFLLQGGLSPLPSPHPYTAAFSQLPRMLKKAPTLGFSVVVQHNNAWHVY